MSVVGVKRAVKLCSSWPLGLPPSPNNAAAWACWLIQLTHDESTCYRPDRGNRCAASYRPPQQKAHLTADSIAISLPAGITTCGQIPHAGVAYRRRGRKNRDRKKEEKKKEEEERKYIKDD